MIQPNELRIGNFVLNIHGEISTIMDGKMIDKFEWWHPIPLTEEWLLKFGFEEVVGVPFFEIDLQENIGQIHINPSNGVVWLKHHRNELSVSNPNSIKYVHQLQNLYFALTQRELELKEETV